MRLTRLAASLRVRARQLAIAVRGPEMWTEAWTAVHISDSLWAVTRNLVGGAAGNRTRFKNGCALRKRRI